MMDSTTQCSQQVSKKIHELTEDRLTSLPDNVIEAILVRLPLRDAVRTSILSRAWRYQWNYLLQLVFDKIDFPLPKGHSQIDYDNRLGRIVDQVLLLHRGPIYKFKLSTELSSCRDMDRWTLLASRNGIREFIIHKRQGGMYEVPSCLFLCEGITYLELYWCILVPPASFGGFRYLTTLDLQNVSFSNTKLDSLISNCPVLTKLKLVNISNCSRLNLCAPNLVELLVENVAIDLSFEKTPVLANVSINMWYYNEYWILEDGAICELIYLLHYLPSIKRLDLVGETYQILASQGVVSVRLPFQCPVLHLSLLIDFEDRQHMLVALCIFRSSPFLHKVDIMLQLGEPLDAIEEISLRNFWEAQEDLNCFFSELKTLNVSGYHGSYSELKFIEFVLANAPVLEMIKIEVEAKVDPMAILRKLIRFRRISSIAEILIPE